MDLTKFDQSQKDELILKESKAGRPTWKKSDHTYKKTMCEIRDDYKVSIRLAIAQGEALSQDQAIEIALNEFFEKRGIKIIRLI